MHFATICLWSNYTKPGIWSCANHTTHTIGIVWPGSIEPAAAHTTKSRPSLTGSHRTQYQRDRGTDRERKEGQRTQSRPRPTPKRDRGTKKDEARRKEKHRRTRDRCRHPCMICTTDRESWRESARETKSWREGKKREQRQFALFQPLFYASPRTQASRTGNPCRRDRLSVRTQKSPCINSPFVEYAEPEAINAHFHPIQTGDGLHFPSRPKPGSQPLYPLLHLPNNFIISPTIICPLKNDLFPHYKEFDFKFGFVSLKKERFLKNSDLTNLTQECIVEKEKLVHHR